MSKILCFTGTRAGMSLGQRKEIRQMMTGSALMEMRRLSRILHGGCIGADVEFHAILAAMHLLSRVEVYPSNMPDMVAALADDDLIAEVHPPMDPIERNKLMVMRAHSLLAAPREFREVVRGSGTWATVRAARRKGIPVLIVYPDGTRHLEGGI